MILALIISKCHGHRREVRRDLPRRWNTSPVVPCLHLRRDDWTYIVLISLGRMISWCDRTYTSACRRVDVLYSAKRSVT
jgi:hypothetical protein